MTRALDYLSDRLRIASVVWDIKRNDQLSGGGDGRIWQAELSDPLWTAQINLQVYTTDALKQIAARIRGLRGAQDAFLLCDPISKYPQSDPTGAILGASNVQINSIDGRDGISLKGLPAFYRLTAGDKMQITYGTDPERYVFIEVSDSVQADASGVTAVFPVFPDMPFGVGANFNVILARPACRCIILPTSHDPGTAYKDRTEGATFKVIQKR